MQESNVINCVNGDIGSRRNRYGKVLSLQEAAWPSRRTIGLYRMAALAGGLARDSRIRAALGWAFAASFR